MKTQHEMLMEDPEFRRLLAIETLVTESSEVVARLMAEQSLSKADLARKLGKSRAWVTQLLSGKANMTIRTLAELMYALGSEVKLQAQPSSWRGAEKARDVGWRPVVFQMDNYLVEQPMVPQEAFQLGTDLMTSAQEDLASVIPGEGTDHSEYAA